MHLNKNSFKVNFNMDILSGCKWSCPGCLIDRVTNFSFEKKELSNFSNLINTFKETPLTPSIFILGPTDIFTARNTSSLLNNSNVTKIINKFERLTLNSTFLEIDLDILNIINSKLRDIEIEFKIILDIRYIKNDEYMEKISSNYLKAKDILKNFKVVCHPQLNLFETTSTKLKSLMGDYDYLNERSYRYFDQGVDYAFSFSRDSNYSVEKIKKVLLFIKEKFNLYVNFKSSGEGIHFDASNLKDLSEYILSYRSGSLFYAPGIYDEYVSFKDFYKIPIQKWHAKELIKYKNNRVIEMLEYASQIPCADCQYVNKCIDKGAIYFMKEINQVDCIFPLTSLNAVNSSAV